MTTKKDLKRLVRARMAETGEPYTQALAAVRGRTPPERLRVSLIDELHDVTEAARSAGLSCDAEVSQRRWAELDDEFFARAFARLMSLIALLREHPGVACMRSALIDGVAPKSPRIAMDLAFFEQVTAGFRGVSPSGALAAIDVADARGATRLIVFVVRQRPTSPKVGVLLQIDPRLDSVSLLAAH